VCESVTSVVSVACEERVDLLCVNQFFRGKSAKNEKTAGRLEGYTIEDIDSLYVLL